MTLAAGDDTWRNCNICKTGIGFGRDYFVCSVSTCNRKRTGLIFCGLSCFEAHLPEARHRDAWAEQLRAPTRAVWQAALNAEEEEKAERVEATPDRVATSGASAAQGAGDRRNATIVRPGTPAAATSPAATSPTATSPTANKEPEFDNDVLVVVSKLKKFVRDWSGMNTSDAAMPVISDYLRDLCRDAIRQAGLDGRRTVLDRDFVKVISQRDGRR